MKILLHCVYYPPEVGGLESHVHTLARALVERGHEVRVVTSRSMAGLPARETLDGVEVHRTWLPARSAPGWVAHALGSVPRTTRLARDTDVIHAQAFGSIVPCLAGRSRSGAPLVATLHTSHFLRRAEKPAWRPILRALIRRPERVLAASAEIAAVAEELAPGVRVEALVNGVETSVFRPVEPALEGAGGWRIVVPRRLFEKNGVEYFVRAFPAVLEEAGAGEAVIIGDGPERTRLEALARELGVAGRIRFLGRRSHDEMPGILSGADLAVFPSLMEATSVAALEAMACEVPVAASRVGGLPEIVDGEVGGLFEPADPAALAVTVARLLGDPELKERGRKARERVVERWSVARLVERHLEIYEELRQRPGRGPAGGPGEARG